MKASLSVLAALGIGVLLGVGIMMLVQRDTDAFLDELSQSITTIQSIQDEWISISVEMEYAAEIGTDDDNATKLLRSYADLRLATEPILDNVDRLIYLTHNPPAGTSCGQVQTAALEAMGLVEVLKERIDNTERDVRRLRHRTTE